MTKLIKYKISPSLHNAVAPPFNVSIVAMWAANVPLYAHVYLRSLVQILQRAAQSGCVLSHQAPAHLKGGKNFYKKIISYEFLQTHH